jgi:sugar O-acyltransferase (sialic acid O-acetyltransferase NeuD family)
MRPVLLVGASGLAREANEAIREAGVLEVAGFVDDDPARWGTSVGGIDVLGGWEVIYDRTDHLLLLCPGKGSVRSRIAHALKQANVEDSRYATVVHPSVSVPSSVSIGTGSIVLASSVLTANVAVGTHVVLMPHITLTHDVVVGDFATLCAGVTIGGGVRVGPRAYIGMQASIRERCWVGADATVGMGSVVLTDVPAGEVWFGVPAKPSESPALPTATTGGTR